MGTLPGTVCGPRHARSWVSGLLAQPGQHLGCHPSPSGASQAKPDCVFSPLLPFWGLLFLQEGLVKAEVKLAGSTGSRSTSAIFPVSYCEFDSLCVSPALHRTHVPSPL